MGVYELIIIPLANMIVGNLISNFLIRLIDKRKNDRHSPKHGH